MATLYTNIDSNKRKTWLLLSGFAVFIVFFGWFLSYYFQNQAILYLAVALGIIQPLIAYYSGDKIMLTMSGAIKIDHESNRDLYHSVENLCITAGLPMPKIYIIDDTAPNAFACGRDEKHSSIAITKGLLMKLNKRELEGVIAHELSHIGNRDILIATITTVLVGIIVLLADWSLRFTFFGGKKSNNDNDRDNGQLQIILMVVALVLAILAPLFAQVIQLAISRKREFVADSAGVLLTRDPEGLIAALEKISADSEPLEVANRATDHAYIASPFKSDTDAKVGFFTKLFMTHPPISERVAALRRGQ
ncbi:MAG: M48 family metallopeptidase [Patescibacteria group bacterium]|nr:M48 family metallopeptidase [Patescibacteria group bacterium]